MRRWEQIHESCSVLCQALTQPSRSRLACLRYLNRQTSDITGKGRRMDACLINIKFASSNANDSITRKTFESISRILCSMERGETRMGEEPMKIEYWWWQVIRSINEDRIIPVRRENIKDGNWRAYSKTTTMNQTLIEKFRRKTEQSDCLFTLPLPFWIYEWFFRVLFNYNPAYVWHFFFRIFTCWPSLFRDEKKNDWLEKWCVIRTCCLSLFTSVVKTEICDWLTSVSIRIQFKGKENCPLLSFINYSRKRERRSKRNVIDVFMLY